MVSKISLAPRAYTLSEFSHVFRLSKPSVYKLIHAGKLHSILVQGRRLIPAGEGERLLRQPAAPLGPRRGIKREEEAAP